MPYYCNETFNNGEWVYSVAAYKQEYLAKYLDFQIQETSLKFHVRDVINKFVQTGGVNKEKFSERPPVSEDVVEDLGALLEQNLQTSLTRLFTSPGFPQSTMHAYYDLKSTQSARGGTIPTPTAFLELLIETQYYEYIDTKVYWTPNR